ncbi:TSUP family transporter [Proteus sp. G2672]|nr:MULTISPECIES: sulfite exporter TauE/SafE family protein [Proteus]MCO8050629.1 sulfite exporter TauE/SafE family protein [Proteus penneri]MCX2587132.1 sulfite exporter TauE/SafE family protein [Proteus penneri]NBL76093.1 TSUP family transporter [Proteus sp. G2672]NBM58001.1 TSUP family transporter [Proteus sp. G2667]NBM80720.1 TSUP family transporter [Proteus sp. G2659]
MIMSFIAVILLAILSGLISGVVGTGSSILLIPALTYVFGAKEAVPIMALASVMGNLSRIYLWRHSIRFKPLFYYLLPGIPAVILGANTLWVMPEKWLNVGMGLFFILMIPVLHLLRKYQIQMKTYQVIMAGAVIGYLTGVVFSTGPLTIPIFSAYGLTLGPLLATEAAASFVIYLTKALTFSQLGAVNSFILISGVLVGCGLTVGNYLGKKLVLKLTPRLFQWLLDAMLIFAGSSLFINGVIN